MKIPEGYVSCVQIFVEKGRPGEKRETVTLQEGAGILGDRHADGGDRQISILLSEVRDWMEAQPVPGLCFARYKENIRISGLTPEMFREGVHFKIGDAELEITGFSKRCFPECQYVSEEKECVLLHGAFYARVVKSGKISNGDGVICMQINA